MRVRIIEPIAKLDIPKKKVCAYARVSTESDKQGESLENQMTYYENFITSNSEYEYASIFVDSGITRIKDNRLDIILRHNIY
jgi:predicted site-specific integrase-resolvase